MTQSDLNREIAKGSHPADTNRHSKRWLVDAVGIIVGFVGLSIGLREYFEVNYLRTETKYLESEISTRYVGGFPTNLKDINQILSGAYNHLDIMADYVGYGHYSAPRDFQDYQAALEQKAPNVKIRMLVYARCLAEKTHSEQFPPDKFPAERRKEVFQQFCRQNGGQDCPTYEAFNKLLFYKQQKYMEDLLDKGVSIRLVTQKLPFFVWDADYQKAVFSFPSERPEVSEVSLRTQETKLAEKVFKDIFDNTWAASSGNELKSQMVDPTKAPNVVWGQCVENAAPSPPSPSP